MAELPNIRAEKKEAAKRRQLLVAEYRRRVLQATPGEARTNETDANNVTLLDYEFSHATYRGDGQDKVGCVKSVGKVHELFRPL